MCSINILNQQIRIGYDIIYILILKKIEMIQTEKRPLKQLFNDIDYAWQLLEYQVRLQTLEEVSSQDISTLLQLYMKGVQKMNQFLDYRQTFFKEKVITLMSRPTVMKTLNNKNVMSKKKINFQPIAQKSLTGSQKQLNSKKNTSNKRIDGRNDLLILKEKKKQIEVRLAYGMEQNTPDYLHKIIVEQTHKQQKINWKINRIVDQHDEILLKRLKERKLKTQAAKSLSNALVSPKQLGSTRQMIFDQKPKDIQQIHFSSCILIENNKQNDLNTLKTKRKYRSLSPAKYKKKSKELKALQEKLDIVPDKENIKI